MGSVVQVHPDPPPTNGGVAQLGEHLLCKQGVIGSIPFTSTNFLDVGCGDEKRYRHESGCNGFCLFESYRLIFILFCSLKIWKVLIICFYMTWLYSDEFECGQGNVKVDKG